MPSLLHPSQAALLVALAFWWSPAPGTAQESTAAPQSAPVSEISYTVTFDESLARTRTIRVAMSLATAGGAPILLSLPAWTPGAYEISNFARWVTSFDAVGDGRPLVWDKLDSDTWRIRPAGARSITVTIEFYADTLDNAIAWARPDFAFFNGTNVFLFPEGRPLDYRATVRVQTAPNWRVATGMTAAGAARTYTAANYHDLVDMPFFIGRFDFDSTRIAERWVRLATYPVGSLGGAHRTEVWDQLRRILPPQIAVFQETPFETYTVMQIADSSYGGASGLEHQNSHVNVISPFAIGNRLMPALMPSLYAHEIFHAWNVKRLRPADLWPYRYDQSQPSVWLWVSEGITDYYADLTLVRGGIADSAAFFRATSEKMTNVASLRPVALEDASLSTWVQPVDGTGYIYYDKGSLVGLLLDVLIRDASDNRGSLDDVMRRLYQETYKQGRGFTGDQWWSAVSAAAGGRSFADFDARYIDGRLPLPYDSVLPLAGMRLVPDSTRPRFGIASVGEDAGIRVTSVEAGSTAGLAGVRADDVIVAIGEIPVDDPEFGQKLRARYAREGMPVTIQVRRGTQTLTLRGQIQLDRRIEADPRASPKAVRIRNGLLRGTVDR